MSVMEPLRREHRELLPHIEELRTAADAVGFERPTNVRALVEGCHDFVANHLLPHAHAEEAALYPVVDQLMAGVPVTATMRREHVEVARLAGELNAVRALDDLESPVVQRRLRAVLYGLHAVVALHFAKEEEVYLPILEAGLDADEADVVFAAMREAAHGAHAG